MAAFFFLNVHVRRQGFTKDALVQKMETCYEQLLKVYLALYSCCETSATCEIAHVPQEAQDDLKNVMNNAKKTKRDSATESQPSRKEKPRKRKEPHPRVPTPPPSSCGSSAAEEDEEEDPVDSSDADQDVFGKRYRRKRPGGGAPTAGSDKLKSLCCEMSPALIRALPTEMMHERLESIHLYDGGVYLA